MESCAMSVHKGHVSWVHYLLFSLKQLYLLIPSLSEALREWSLALGQLFWLFFWLLCQKSCEEQGRGRFMVKWCSFHFRIMAPTVLTGTFRSLEISLKPMPSVCFATIRLRRYWARSLLLPIMRCPLCDTLVMRNLFICHQLGLNQLILICRGQDCFLNTDRFQLVSWLSMPFCNSFSACVQYFTLLHLI